MATHAIIKLQLSLLGFAVVPDVQWIGGDAFAHKYEGDKVHITQRSTGITRMACAHKLLEAKLKDVSTKAAQTKTPLSQDQSQTT